MTVQRGLEDLLAGVLAACRQHYGERLVSLAVFGSVGRGVPRPDSDVDFLIVAEDLPKGRVARAADFRAVEQALALRLEALRSEGITPELSPVFKTPAELSQGSPLLLDMVEDARLLHDREDFLRSALAALRGSLERLGARRVWRGSAWYWDLKPDYAPGEVFDL
jgi:predicted nucleotidyltransferase